jgi:NADPH:quinone reductase-like Zn-dependent oxidoreductase
MDTIKAMVLSKYGPPEVLHLGKVPRPSPARDEVLVQVQAAGVGLADCRRRAGELSLLSSAKAPAVLGYDAAGVVISIGADVRNFHPGDEVFGLRLPPQGGTYAELVTLSEHLLMPRPNAWSLSDAAAVPSPALTALLALRDRGRIARGSAVLILAATSAVGVYAVQLAKALGGIVTGVCSAASAEHIRSLGAGQIIDSQKDDLTQLVGAFEIILDPLGQLTLESCHKMLAPKGRLVQLPLSARGLLGGITSLLSDGPRLTLPVLLRPTRADLDQLYTFAERGKLRPVIERSFPLAQAAAAHRYLEQKSSSADPPGPVLLRID